MQKFQKGLKKIFQLFNKPKNVSKLAEGENPQTRKQGCKEVSIFQILIYLAKKFFSYLR